MSIRTAVSATAVALATALALTGCVAGEDTAAAPAPEPDATASADAPIEWSADTLNIDFATYNPLSLVIKDQGWLEEALGGDVTVNWIQ